MKSRAAVYLAAEPFMRTPQKYHRSFAFMPIFVFTEKLYKKYTFNATNGKNMSAQNALVFFSSGKEVLLFLNRGLQSPPKCCHF